MATQTTSLKLSKPAYSDTADISVINTNMDTIDTAVSKILPVISGTTNNSGYAISAGEYFEANGSLYKASASIPTGSAWSSSATAQSDHGAINALNSKIENNYTDYNSNGDYHICICQSGKMVIVSGEVFGKGIADYITGVRLPRPFGYTPDNSELLANAVIFHARNQHTGTIQQMRCGADFYIYREAAMTDGQPYSFAFSYCKG